MKNIWRLWLGFFIVIGLGLTFRFYDITHYPPGLFPDQAANGEDALLILQGDHRPFFPRGNGREGLFFYIQAGFIKAFGIGVWPMFAASAAVGAAAVLLTYLAIWSWAGATPAFFGALFMASSYWAVTISRTGFRAGLIPLFVAGFTASVGLLVRSYGQGKYWLSYMWAVAAGIFFMGGFYSYIAYRVMIGVLLAMAILFILPSLHAKIGFPHFRRYWKHFLLAVCTGLITIAPLAAYFWQHPGSFLGRASQVSIFNPDLQVGGGLLPTLAWTTRQTVTSFFAGHGDINWRQNVAGFPLLNPLVALLFLVGLVITVEGVIRVWLRMLAGQEIHKEMIYPYLLLLLVAMMAPVVTTAEGIPHGLRSVGMMVPIFFLSGLGAARVWRLLSSLKQPLLKSIGQGAVIGAVVLFGLYDATLYFAIARNDSAAYYAYRGDLTTAAQYINEYRAHYPDKPRPYLVLDAYSLQTVHYLCSVSAHEDGSHPDAAAHKYQELDPAQSHLTTLAPNEIMIFTQSTIFDAERYIKVHPDVKLLTSQKNRWGQEIMRVYGAPEKSKSVPDAASSLDA